MKNQKGFTLVEVIVVVFLIGLISAIFIPNYKKYKQYTNGQLQSVEKKEEATSPVQCLEGYKFIKDSNGNLTQVLNKDGGGISCD